MKGPLRKITDYGGRFARSKSEKRNIILSNYAAVIGCAAMWVLTGALIIVYGFDSGAVGRILTTSVFFFIPIVLNRFGFIVVSRVLLCSLIPTMVFGVSILDLKAGETMSSSSFVGLRLFLLVGLCFPFLLFDLKQRSLLILGLAFPVASLIFFDPIFGLFGVGYLANPAHDLFYEFSNIRSLVSAFAICTSLYLLKLMVEYAEKLNRVLLLRLEEQNKIIRRQAEAKVYKLDEELKVNLRRLSEREFILSQSQRVAKFGSWEYDPENEFTFWSDEMYNILGLDKDIDLKSRALFETLLGEAGHEVVQSTIRLLRTGQPFDRIVNFVTPQQRSKWIMIYAFPQYRDQRVVGVRGICHDITDYKEAEEKLRASEYQYRSLFEQASDFIAVFGFDGKFHDVNMSWCKTFGYSKEEMLDLRIEDVVEPEELRITPIRYDALRVGDQIYSTRHVRKKDGTIIEVESNAKMFQGDKILAIGRDVTKMREVQRQIEISEARFRGAFERSPIGMALVSMEGRWLRVNRELSRVVGYSEEELLAMSIRDIVLPNPGDGDFDLRRLPFHHDGEGVHSERQCVRKDGVLVWVSLNASLIKDHEEAPLYFVVQIENITAQKEAEEKLRVYEANLRATINNTDVIIWAVDRNFRLIMFNNQFARHFRERYGFDVSIGSLPFTSISTPESEVLKQKWRALLSRALAGDRIRLEEQRFGVDFQYSLNPIIEGSEVIGVSVFADNVTERKTRERQLNEANKKISELRLMALRSVMSPHFIFNVLNSIQYFIAKNDRLNAINYLSSFSKLVRSILSHSVTDKVSLLDEIQMLKAYVQLELIRFENKFTFLFEVDPGIDVESIVIPSLLIQPYVENAILHGLYNKGSDGKLSIRVREEEDGMLLFEIEDNGIGRTAAMELRKRNFLPHPSMGTNITEERLKLINQGHRTGFEVEDLMENGMPSGTRVRIRISHSAD